MYKLLIKSFRSLSLRNELLGNLPAVHCLMEEVFRRPFRIIFALVGGVPMRGSRCSNALLCTVWEPLLSVLFSVYHWFLVLEYLLRTSFLKFSKHLLASCYTTMFLLRDWCMSMWYPKCIHLAYQQMFVNNTPMSGYRNVQKFL